jgi:hypothetical protein
MRLYPSGLHLHPVVIIHHIIKLPAGNQSDETNVFTGVSLKSASDEKTFPPSCTNSQEGGRGDGFIIKRSVE